MAGGGGGASQKQAPRPGRAQRAAGWREKTEAHFDRGPRKTVAGSVLRCATETVGREDCGHCRKTGFEKERSSRVVLQPETETETHEVRGPTLTGFVHVVQFDPFLTKHVLI